jgi:hypothetical protein
MATDKYIDKARELGYEVSVSFEGYDDVPTVYHVEGHGISTQYSHNDEVAWANLVNRKAHAHREKSARAVNPEDDFTWTPEEQLESALEASKEFRAAQKEASA